MTPRLDRIAARQLGLVTTPQLRRLGLGKAAVHRQVGVSALFPLRHEIYRVAGAPITWEQVVLAAVLAAGADAVASHTTAAAIWDLKHSDRHSAGLHVTATSRIRLEGVSGHRRRLAAPERILCNGIPVTTTERTLVDLAGTLSPRQLAECVDDGLRRGLIHLERLRQLVALVAATGGCHPALAPLHQALADRRPGYRPGGSDWEQEMDRQWDQLGLPKAVRQFRVDAAGRSYRIDRAIPDLKIGIEWDGFDAHGTRCAFDRDSDRRADLIAEGWLIIPFTSNSTLTRIARTVRRAVEDRSH